MATKRAPTPAASPTSAALSPPLTAEAALTAAPTGLIVTPAAPMVTLPAAAQAKSSLNAKDVTRANSEEKSAIPKTNAPEKAATVNKAKPDAERQKTARLAASGANANATVSAPPRRTVEELSTIGNAAFKRGELSAARTAWNELVAHPEATARSKAVAYNNLAISYCQNGDDSTCERMYASMLRADRAYGAEAHERDLPQFKRPYERAARSVRVQSQ